MLKSASKWLFIALIVPYFTVNTAETTKQPTNDRKPAVTEVIYE